jgi:hypothetical protein
LFSLTPKQEEVAAQLVGLIMGLLAGGITIYGGLTSDGTFLAKAFSCFAGVVVGGLVYIGGRLFWFIYIALLLFGLAYWLLFL